MTVSGSARLLRTKHTAPWLFAFSSITTSFIHWPAAYCLAVQVSAAAVVASRSSVASGRIIPRGSALRRVRRSRG